MSHEKGDGKNLGKFTQKKLDCSLLLSSYYLSRKLTWGGGVTKKVMPIALIFSVFISLVIQFSLLSYLVGF